MCDRAEQIFPRAGLQRASECQARKAGGLLTAASHPSTHPEKEVFPLKEEVEVGGGVSVMETPDTMGASIKTPFSNTG